MALAVQNVSLLPSVSSSVSSRSSSLRPSRPITANANRDLNTKFVVDWNNPAILTSSNKTKTNDENLQEAFRRFREQRMVCLIIKKFLSSIERP